MTIETAAVRSNSAQPNTAPVGRLAPPLRLFLRIQLLLVCVCAAVELFCHFVLHLGEPYDYPFLSRQKFFWDFLLFGHKFLHFHTPEFFTTETFYRFSYPAPLAVFYEIFYAFGVMAAPLWFLFIMVVAFTATVLFERALIRHGVSRQRATRFALLSLVFAFPLWFDVKQGNVEFAILVLVAAGIWAYCAERNVSAAVCFGVAGSMKIFPLIYLGLLLSRRKYREIILSFMVAGFATVVSLWLVGGRDIGNSWRQVQIGAAGMRRTNLLEFRVWDIGWDHSLFGFYKRIAPHLPPPEILGRWLTAYMFVMALAGVALYFFRIRRMPIVNQVLCLSVASILLPPLSAEYTLIHLYVPFGMMALFAQDRWMSGEKIPGLSAAFVCIALLVSPLSEFILHGIHLAGQIKCVVLTVLLVIALRYPFASLNSQLPSSVSEAGCAAS